MANLSIISVSSFNHHKKGLPGSGKPTVWVYAYELPTGPGGYGDDGGMRSFLSSLTKVLSKIKKANTLQ
jgi:hypothetical protein